MSRFVFRDGKIVPAGAAYAERHAATAHARSDLPAPRVTSSAIEVKSMLDGQTYTCSRTYERHVRENGCVIVGNDTAALHPPRPSKDRTQNRKAVEAAVSDAGF